MLLEVRNIDVLYDDFQVIWDVSLEVGEGEMVALLGPNGSGKSTVLNTVSNLVSHRQGEIRFDGEPIGNQPTHRRTAAGISHVLERRRVFPHLGVGVVEDDADQGGSRIGFPQPPEGGGRMLANAVVRVGLCGP